MPEKNLYLYLPRVNANANYGFWAMMICQHRFTNCNKCTTVAWVACRVGEVVHLWGQGINGNSVLCAQFYCETRTVLKK